MKRNIYGAMNIQYKSLILVIGLLFTLSASISAAPGDLDPTFGNGGIAIADRGNTPIIFYTVGGMAIQPDGKIIVVGEGNAGAPGYWHSAVVRFNPDGSLDSSFADRGAVVTQLGSYYDAARALAIQPDRKIVVVSSVSDGLGVSGKFGVVRYNPNGSLDTSFNGNGIVLTPGTAGWNNSVAIQTDGKIVVAGSDGNGSFAIFRYNPDGSLDTSFNGSGTVLTSVGHAGSVAIQADGKIIAAGGTGLGGSGFTLVRYNEDGSLDTSFNYTGIASAGNAGSYPFDLAVQRDGKIVVVGYAIDFNCVRFNPDGSLDTSFGGTGKILIPFYPGSVAIQPNGKIVVGGINFQYFDGDAVFAVGRLNPKGSLDTSFNGTGIVTTSVGKRYGNASYDEVGLVAIQADGKIVLAGDSGPDEFKSFVVIRYQGDSVTPASCPNPIDCAEFFVRQHYQDFLNREPDAAGLAFWTNEINACGFDAQCVQVKRINVSAAYFLSIEFQQSGYLVYRFYKAAFGNLPGALVPVRRSDFLPDAQAIGQGVIVNQGNWQQQLETNKQNYANAFVQRPAFTSAYPTSMTPGTFVDTLFANAGVIPSSSERTAAIAEFSSASNTADPAARARALRLVAENSTLQQQEFNRAFVLMQYFGYLRRNPNDAPDVNFDGYNFWLAKLNQFNGDFVQAEMVKAFLTSTEYRRRFAP